MYGQRLLDHAIKFAKGCTLQWGAGGG